MPITDNWSNSIFPTVVLAAFVVGVETGDCPVGTKELLLSSFLGASLACTATDGGIGI
jgi:hypothetical protein